MKQMSLVACRPGRAAARHCRAWAREGAPRPVSASSRASIAPNDHEGSAPGPLMPARTGSMKMMRSIAILLLPALTSAAAQAGPCPASGSCFMQHPTPGCDNAACCEMVCAADPFCCNVQWDTICANEASTACSNDACAFQLAISGGTTSFTNVGATTDGPVACGLLGADIWYSYSAPAAGTLTVDTFGSGFDTVLAAYDGCTCVSDLACPLGSTCGNFHPCEGGCICWSTTNQGPVCLPDFFCSSFSPCSAFGGNCPPGTVCVTASCCGTDLCIPLTLCGGGAETLIGSPGGGSGLTGTGQFIEDGGAGGVAGGATGGLLACDDDFGGGVQSQISFQVLPGQCYLIQVGGFNSAQGSGVIHISLDSGLQGDLNGDGSVNVSDLLIVILDWGCQGAACAGDADGNGVTDVNDLVAVVVHWTA